MLETAAPLKVHLRHADPWQAVRVVRRRSAKNAPIGAYLTQIQTLQPCAQPPKANEAVGHTRNGIRENATVIRVQGCVCVFSVSTRWRFGTMAIRLSLKA